MIELDYTVWSKEWEQYTKYEGIDIRNPDAIATYEEIERKAKRFGVLV